MGESRLQSILTSRLERWADSVASLKSRFIDIRGCRTVCLALGPYRNLTTLTAATLSLHPNCQVLNHAGAMIFARPGMDFLSGYTERRFQRFVQFAITLSSTGRRGDYGGSIVHSHAFDPSYSMSKLHANAGGDLLKREIHCLFWKESLLTARRIRERGTDLGEIFARNDRLRFLMPVRNPLDCAISNLKTGHARRFENLPSDLSEAKVLALVVRELDWFARLQRHHPDRFLHFFEFEMSRATLVRIAEFLRLSVDDGWLDRAVAAMKLNPPYAHDHALTTEYRRLVEEHFAELPDWRAGLLKFLAGPAGTA